MGRLALRRSRGLGKPLTPAVGANGCQVTGCPAETMQMVFCPTHFDLLPQRMRDAIWNEYRAGYDKGTHPSNGYRDALRCARDWLEVNTELITQ